MKAQTDRILEILRGAPQGLAARDVADRLGVSLDNIGSRLSKLAAYGVIEKARGKGASNIPACAIYSAPHNTPTLV